MRLRVANPCLYAQEGTRCRVKAVVFAGRRIIARTTLRWRRPRDPARTLRWTLPRRAVRLHVRLAKHESDEPDERGGYSVRLAWSAMLASPRTSTSRPNSKRASCSSSSAIMASASAAKFGKRSAGIARK
jgi:hypothetical protein